jgi:chromatin assembly factor 1 subunit B
MKVLVPEIAAHVMENGEGRNQEMLSVDSHPYLPLFVSAGAGENRVIFWKLNTSNTATAITITSNNASTNNSTTAGSQQQQQDVEWLSFLCEMTANLFENTVNVLRFSPCGKFLACGDSSGLVTVLSLKEECKSWLEVKDEKSLRRVHLRGHVMDVQDFAWSPDSLFGASAGMDNLVLVWDVIKCTEVCRIKEHTHYAQGVAWSPDGNFLASSSFDETVRVHRVTRPSALNKSFSCSEISVLKKSRLFADEFRGPTFCRRLSFSPEVWSGILVAPGGLEKDMSKVSSNDMEVTTAQDEDKVEDNAEVEVTEVDSELKKKRATPAPLIPATHVFRYTLSTVPEKGPISTLKGSAQPSLAVRFHPRPFSLIKNGPEPWLSFISPERSEDVRFVFAVATIDSVLVYDTQHQQPIAVVEKLHYASYTDIAWNISSGVDTLIASSRDGCFSLFRFGEGELGEVIHSVIKPTEVDTSFVAAVNETSGVKLMDVEESEPKDGSEQVINQIDENSVKCIEIPEDSCVEVIEKSPKGDLNVISEDTMLSVVSQQNENDAGMRTSKKPRRVVLENIESSTPSIPAVVEKPVVHSLQPRRIQLQSL